MIGLPNPDQRSVAKTSGFPHPYIYTYTARALPLERILALRGEGITWMGQPSRQGIVLFSVRTEFWRSTAQVICSELLLALFRLEILRSIWADFSATTVQNGSF